MSEVVDPARCKICGLMTPMTVRRAPSSDSTLSAQATYDLAVCSRCGSEFILDGRRGTTEALYRGGTYAPSRPGLDRFLEPLRKLADRERIRHVERLGESDRVLEVGAGDGRFAAVLAARKLTVLAIDPAAAPEDERVERLTLEDLSSAPGSFDAAIFWHVLEHLDDPEAALRRVHELLRPDGRAVIAVPNLDSLQSRIGGEHWFHQDVPRHRTQFTRQGLIALLERCGFTPERVSGFSLDQNLLGMWQTLLNRATREDNVAFRWLKGDFGWKDAPSDAAMTTVLGPLLVFPAILLEGAAVLGKRGGSTIVEAIAR